MDSYPILKVIDLLLPSPTQVHTNRVATVLRVSTVVSSFLSIKRWLNKPCSTFPSLSVQFAFCVTRHSARGHTVRCVRPCSGSCPARPNSSHPTIVDPTRPRNRVLFERVSLPQPNPPSQHRPVFGRDSASDNGSAHSADGVNGRLTHSLSGTV